MKFILIFVLLLNAIPAWSAEDDRKCYPHCNGYTLEQLRNMDLSATVPHNPELYRFRIKGNYRGHQFFKAEVPVYVSNSMEGIRHYGSVEVGREITLDRLTIIRGRMFYRFLLKTDAKGLPVHTWVDGQFIEGFDYARSASKEF